MNENNKNNKEDENKMKELDEEIISEELSKNKIITEEKVGWRYYQYKGSSTGITLKYEEEDYEIVLLSNHRVLLPENHAYTKKLRFNGFLIEN